MAQLGRLFVRPVSVSIAGHVLTQLLAWVVLLPVAIALSATAYGSALPLECAAVALSTLGAWLGHRRHLERARDSARDPGAIPTAHAALAPLMMLLLYARLGFSCWLHWRCADRLVPRALRRARIVLNAAVPVFAWTTLLSGLYAQAGWGRGADQTAIVSHSIAGTALLLYGLALLVTTQTTVPWLKRRHERQSRFDARALIAVGYIVFFGVGGNVALNWGPRDHIHVGLGALLCSAGFLTLHQSKVRPRLGEAIPPVTLFAVGVVIIAHGEPSLELLIMHLPFAIGLMLSSLARALEISLGGPVPLPGSQRWHLRDGWLVRPALLIFASLGLSFGTAEPSELVFRRLHGPADPIACGILLSLILTLVTVLVVIWALGLLALAGFGPDSRSSTSDDLDLDAPADSPLLCSSEDDTT